MRNLLLTHVRVVDWSEGVAGSVACQFLADLGCQVIKIEQPRGDWARHTGPRSGNSQFNAVNRNKLSFGLNLSSDSGKFIFERLFASADVLVTNVRSSALRRMGVDLNRLKRIHPDCIIARLGAYGSSTKFAALPGTDSIIQSASGLMYMVGDNVDPPLRIGFPLVDLTAGRDLAIGVLASLYQRAVLKGPVADVEVDLFSSAASLLTTQWQNLLDTQASMPRSRHLHPGVAPAGSYLTKDQQWITVAVIRETQWEPFCRTLQHPEWVSNAHWKHNKERIDNRQELEDELQRAFSQHTLEEWIERFATTDLLVSPIYSINTINASRHLQSALPLDSFPNGELFIRSPITFHGIFSTAPSVPAPLPGVNSREVLKDLGFTNVEIDNFFNENIVFCFENV